MTSYDYWQNALEGNIGPVHDSDPQFGFYRKRTRKAGPFVPVAIFAHGEEIVALVDGKKADAAEVWSYVCQHPIPEDWYRAKMDGQPWPDEDTTVTASLEPPSMGHNNPPKDEAEVIAGQIEAASAGVKDYETVNDDETASRAQALRSRLLELSGDADKKREALKRPHLDAGTAIDKRWNPLVKGAKAAADKIKAALEAHETRKRNAAIKAAQAAEVERIRLAEIARAADKAEQGPPEPIPLPAAPVEIPVSTAIKGAYGRAASVKTKTVVTEIADIDALFGLLRSHPEVTALFMALAQRAVDRGIAVPGVKTEERAKIT